MFTDLKEGLLKQDIKNKMGKETNISWCDVTWNPARGCRKVDADCRFCYMYRGSLNATRYDPKIVRRTKTVFNLPLKIKEPSKIFTSSLTDFFIEDIDEYRNECWEIIRKCPRHIFQILTKRPERILQNLPEFWDEIKGRCWLGTSIGSQEGVQRLFDLQKVRQKASVLFLSIEPLHGEMDLMYPENIFPDGPQTCCSGQECGCGGMPVEPPIIHGINWCIIGGESGNENGKYKYRPCKIEWIEKIISACKFASVPVFVKQLGTHLSKELKLSDRHGTNMDEWPCHLKIREFPKTK